MAIEVSRPIEDYAVVGDCHTAALVSKDGSVDWLCLPRFDSDACFAALLGGPEQGHWSLAPSGGARTTRRYRPGTLILETRHDTAAGSVSVIDLMPPRGTRPALVRIVTGERGEVRMTMELVLRMGYGKVVPWVHRVDGSIEAIAGPELVELLTPVATHGENLKTVAEFVVREGERVPLALTWYPSHERHSRADRAEPEKALVDTARNLSHVDGPAAHRATP